MIDKSLIAVKEKPHGEFVQRVGRGDTKAKPSSSSASAVSSKRKTVYEEEFKGDPLEMMVKHKYWVFSYGGVHVAHPQRKPAEIAKRFKRVDRGMTVSCLKNDGDYSGIGLNPRAELRVHNYQLQLGKRYVCTIAFSLPSVKNVGAEIFQVMTSNPSKPLLQLEVRKQMVGVRYKKGNGLVVQPLFREYANQTIRMEVEFKITKDKSECIVRGEDGKVLWRESPTTNPASSTIWTQYGVYKNGTGNNSQDQTVCFEYFKIEEML